MLKICAPTYAALQIHPHANNSEGRGDANLNGWLEYFVGETAALFQCVAGEVRKQAGQPAAPEPAALRQLDRRARIVLGLFSRQESITAAEMARRRVSPRARCATSSSAGWSTAGSSWRTRRASCGAIIYRQFIGGISAE